MGVIKDDGYDHIILDDRRIGQDNQFKNPLSLLDDKYWPAQIQGVVLDDLDWTAGIQGDALDDFPLIGTDRPEQSGDQPGGSGQFSNRPVSIQGDTLANLLRIVLIGQDNFHIVLDDIVDNL